VIRPNEDINNQSVDLFKQLIKSLNIVEQLIMQQSLLADTNNGYLFLGISVVF